MLISKKIFLTLSLLFTLFSILSVVLIIGYTAGKNADIRVISWWSGLSVVSVFNFYLWAIAYGIYRKKAEVNSEFRALRRYYPGLTLIYVIVCAYRSFLPRAYVPRTVLVDSWWSNIFLARLGATFAEISFIFLLSFYLDETARTLNSRIGIIIAKLIIPPIIIAQGFVWGNIISTNNLLAVFEESLWAFVGILLLIGLLDFYPKIERSRRPLIIFLCVFVIVFILFLIFIDIPKYYIHYLNDQATGRTYLSFSEGIKDLLGRWVVSYAYEDWIDEMAWLGLYFSTAVWLTIYLINAPQIQKKGTPDSHGD